MSQIQNQLASLLSHTPSWMGTPSELFHVLEEIAGRSGDKVSGNRPATPSWLVRKLKSEKEALEKAGISIEEKRKGKKGERLLIITRVDSPSWDADSNADVISQTDVILADIKTADADGISDARQTDTILADTKGADTIPAHPIPPSTRTPFPNFWDNINHPTTRLIPDPTAPRSFSCDGCEWFHLEWCGAVKPGSFYAVKYLLECPRNVARESGTMPMNDDTSQASESSPHD